MRFFKITLFTVLMVHGVLLQDLSAATLTGVVTDDAGVAIPSATVWVTQNRIVNTLQTDASGKFSMANIDVAMTEVVAYEKGYALGGATALVVGDANVEIKLAVGDLLTLKVIDKQSNPVPGAIIRSMLVSGSFLVSVEDLVPHGLPAIRSDDQGILVIPNLPKEGYIQLVLGHPQFADSSVSYLPVDLEQRNILLLEGKRVGGRVTFEDKGVPGARVSIFKVGPQGQKEFAEVLTDSEGFYHAQVHPDRYSVAAQHEDYASPQPVLLEVPPKGEADPASLAMESPRLIEGSVLYPDKKPCGGARVLFRKEGTIYVDTFTNNEGAFSLRVPGGVGAIGILPPRGFFNPQLEDIKVDLGEARNVAMSPIQLEALPVITGVIQDQDGEAPGPVMVTAMNLPVRYSVLTDELGNLTFPLDFMPYVKKLHLRLEHGKRFQRLDLELPVQNPKPFSEKLKPFEPDLAPRPAVPGRNNLGGLVGEPAPELRGTEWLNSEPVQLESLKGKVVVLLFWAGFDDDMGPVVIHELLSLHKLFADVDDVAFIGIHDASSGADEIRGYIDGYGIPFPILRDEDLQTTFSIYNIVFIPQVVVLDKQGKVRYYQVNDRLLTCIKGLRRE